MNTRRQSGFTRVALVIVLGVILVLGGAILLFLSRQDKTQDVTLEQRISSDAEQGGAAKTVRAESGLTAFTFKYEKLSLQYDATSWKLTSNYADISESCGESESLVLKNGENALLASFGTCGKGGGICFYEANSGCTAESLELAKLQLAPDVTKYVVAYRTSVDAGATWNYAVGVSDEPKCLELCTFTAKNVANKISQMSLDTPGYKRVSDAAFGLAEYAALPEVKSGIAVLKSIKY
jgi:type II secretory pathway pseudopilin PulG